MLRHVPDHVFMTQVIETLGSVRDENNVPELGHWSSNCAHGRLFL